MKGKLFSTSAAILTMVTAALIVGSCADDDVYNPNAVVESTLAEYAANWEDTFGEIDEDQDWNMAKEINAIMSITKDALSTYNLQLYTENPRKSDDAYLLADYEVITDNSGYATTTFNVDIPEGTEDVYAAYKDNENYFSGKTVAIEDGAINVEFGSSSSKSKNKKVTTYSAAKDIDTSIPSYEEYAPYTSEDLVYEQIADAKIFEQWTSSTNSTSTIWDDSIQNGGKIAMIVGNGESKFIEGTYWNGYTNPVTELYIVVENGGTLTTDQNKLYLINTNNSQISTQIIVLDGGTFKIESSNGFELDYAQLIVFDGGTVTGSCLTTGNFETVYNASVEGYDDGIFNAGTIELEKLNLAKANIHNKGTIKVTSFDTSNSGVIINNGKVYCETFGTTSDQGGEIWTNCFFYCKTYCKGSYFKIGEGASLESEDIEVFGYVGLNEGSMLRAWNKFTLGNCMIKAPTTGYALVTTDLLYYYDNMETSGDIYGNLFLEYDTITTSSNDATYWNNVIVNYANNDSINYGYDCQIGEVGSASYFTVSSNTDDIEASDITSYSCSGHASYYYYDEDDEDTEDDDSTGSGDSVTGGDEDTSDGDEDTDDDEDSTDDDEDSTDGEDTDDDEEEEIEEVSMIWTLACEDLGDTDDYDFNDIVFTIEHVSGSTTATVTPWAAGGIYESYIMYNGETVNGETHKWIESSATTDENGEYEMLNTTSKGTPGSSVTVTVPSDFSMSDDMGGFSIMVNGENTVTITAPSSGSAPQMLLINGEWAWPKERVTIQAAYPDFANWNVDDSSTDWVNSKVSGNVVE